MTGIMQSFVGASYGFPNNWPVANIGDAYGGGFFAGQINVSGTKYNLIIAPKASGETISQWGPELTVIGASSVVDGPANTATIIAQGSSYTIGVFCNGLNSGSGLNGYKDWYIPAKNELEVLYYFLKPSTTANSTSNGANPNAVPPEPDNTNYSSNLPAQTSVTAFRQGGSEALAITNYFSSTEYDMFHARSLQTSDGTQGITGKSAYAYVRAVRRVLA